MKVAKTFVTIYRQPWEIIDWERREEWFKDRQEGLTYKSALEGEEAAEEAFHLTNAPEDSLTSNQKLLLKRLEFKGPSLSVGDVVRIEPIVRSKLPEYYICKSFGWEKFTGDVIQLIKHFN